MEINKLSVVCFSPTGGTKKTAQILGSAMGYESEEFDVTVNGVTKEFGENEIILAAVPSFGGRVPEAAVERMKMLKGNNTPAVILVAYGNRAYEDTMIELKDTLELNGFIVTAAVSAVTEHSIMHKFGAGRPDEADTKELRGFAEGIRNKINTMEKAEAVDVPGNKEYKHYGGVPLKPKAGKGCIKCGACAKECPVGAILVNSPEKTDESKCVSCMRCVKVCPYDARGLNKVMLMAAEAGLKKALSGHKENEIFL